MAGSLEDRHGWAEVKPRNRLLCFRHFCRSQNRGKSENPLFAPQPTLAAKGKRRLKEANKLRLLLVMIVGTILLTIYLFGVTRVLSTQVARSEEHTSEL